MLTAIVVGLAGSYLLRAALVHVGGVNLESPSALRHLAELGLDWRFWAGGTLIVIILLISLELYGSDELSKVVPLYSLSYVLIAVTGQSFSMRTTRGTAGPESSPSSPASVSCFAHDTGRPDLATSPHAVQRSRGRRVGRAGEALPDGHIPVHAGLRLLR